MNDYTLRDQPPALPDARYAKQKAASELTKAIGGSREVLYRATTVFPFTLFPDTVIIDRTKLTICHKFFFKVSEVMSIAIEDVLNVTANAGPFFGSLKISTRFFDTKKPFIVNYLWREDALHIKRIMQGFIIANQQGIDSTALSAKELAVLLDKLGEGAPDEAA